VTCKTAKLHILDRYLCLKHNDPIHNRTILETEGFTIERTQGRLHRPSQSSVSVGAATGSTATIRSLAFYAKARWGNC
jgi:hypothetical protein